tara:strand:- start:1235 stop:1537 length:303 start_codon:yes stop_codon:yes gene_type:complete
MDLIQIHNNKGALSPYALSIKEFKDLKVDELAYIYFMVDHRSPFSVYEWEQRLKEVKTSIFGDKKWSPSAKVLGGCKAYDILIETSAVRLLKAARESIIK